MIEEVQTTISLQKNNDGSFSPTINRALICCADGHQLAFKTRQAAVAAAQLRMSENELSNVEAAGNEHLHREWAEALRTQIQYCKLEVEKAEKRPEVERAGLEALTRIFNISHGASGQCEHAARFLLACYNGARFPFDFTRLRCLDTGIFYDCMAILEMDSRPQKNVHLYFENGSSKFEALAKRWRL